MVINPVVTDEKGRGNDIWECAGRFFRRIRMIPVCAEIE